MYKKSILDTSRALEKLVIWYNNSVFCSYFNNLSYNTRQILIEQDWLVRVLFLINIFITIWIIGQPPESWIYLKTLIGIVVVFLLPGFLISHVSGLLTKKDNYIQIGVVSLGTGITVIISILYLRNYIELPINHSIIKIILLLLLMPGMFFIYQIVREKNDSRTEPVWCKENVIIWTLFNLLLYLFIVPTKGLFVAPLHDPVGLSLMGAELANGNYLLKNTSIYSRFYPPFGGYIIAVLSSMTDIPAPKLVLIVTNLFNLFGVFAFTVFINYFIKFKYGYISSILAYSFFITYPAALYYNAGKNAQIISYYFLFYTLILFYRSIHSRTWRSKFISALAVVTSILVHYSNLIVIVYASLLLCVAYFTLYRKKEMTVSIFAKDIIQWISVVPLSAMLLAHFLTVKNDPYYGAGLVNNNLVHGKIFNRSIWRFFELFWDTLYSLSHNEGQAVLTLCVLGYLSLFYYIIKKPGSFSLFFLLTPFVLFLFVQSSLPSISKIAKLQLYQVLVIGGFWFFIGLYSIPKFRILKVLVLILVVFYSNQKYQKLITNYERARHFSVVTQADLNAFEWVKKNIPHDQYILPANVKLRGSSQPFNLDAALYLQAYTKREVAIAFWGGNRFHFNRVDIKNMYRKLSANVGNKAHLGFFTNRSINYIYFGKHRPWGTFGSVLIENIEKYPELYDKVYNEAGVSIFKIIQNSDSKVMLQS